MCPYLPNSSSYIVYIAICIITRIMFPNISMFIKGNGHESFVFVWLTSKNFTNKTVSTKITLFIVKFLLKKSICNWMWQWAHNPVKHSYLKLFYIIGVYYTAITCSHLSFLMLQLAAGTQRFQRPSSPSVQIVWHHCSYRNFALPPFLLQLKFPSVIHCFTVQLLIIKLII